MSVKQKIALGFIVLLGLLIVFIYVPRVVNVQGSEPLYREWAGMANQGKEDLNIDRCPFCNSTEIYGGGLTQLEISEYDLGGRHIHPYRPMPVVACNNCGAIRLDFQKINRHPMQAMEMLDERLK